MSNIVKLARRGVHPMRLEPLRAQNAHLAPLQTTQGVAKPASLVLYHLQISRLAKNAQLANTVMTPQCATLVTQALSHLRAPQPV